MFLLQCTTSCATSSEQTQTMPINTNFFGKYLPLYCQHSHCIYTCYLFCWSLNHLNKTVCWIIYYPCQQQSLDHCLDLKLFSLVIWTFFFIQHCFLLIWNCFLLLLSILWPFGQHMTCRYNSIFERLLEGPTPISYKFYSQNTPRTLGIHKIDTNNFQTFYQTFKYVSSNQEQLSDKLSEIKPITCIDHLLQHFSHLIEPIKGVENPPSIPLYLLSTKPFFINSTQYQAPYDTQGQFVFFQRVHKFNCINQEGNEKLLIWPIFPLFTIMQGSNIYICASNLNKDNSYFHLPSFYITQEQCNKNISTIKHKTISYTMQQEHL